MVYMAPCVMFLMRADTLRGRVGEGWALEIESFLDPLKWHRADRQVLFLAQKTPSTPSSHAFPPPSPRDSACAWLTNLPVHSLPPSFTWYTGYDGQRLRDAGLSICCLILGTHSGSPAYMLPDLASWISRYKVWALAWSFQTILYMD